MSIPGETSPGIQPFFTASEERYRQVCILALWRIIECYEPLYLPALEASQLFGTPLTRARYQWFEQWLQTLLERGVLSGQGGILDSQKIMQDIAEAVELYGVLHELALGHDSPELRERHASIVRHLFLEGKVLRYSIRIGGNKVEDLKRDLERDGCEIAPSTALVMMESPEFTVREQGERLELVRIRVGDLFSDENMHSFDAVMDEARSRGLYMCPAEVAPYLRYKIRRQSEDEFIYIAMNPIAAGQIESRIFCLECHQGKRILSSARGLGTARWSTDDEFVFCLSP